MTAAARLRDLLLHARWPWALLLGVALAVRLALWPGRTVDHDLYLEPWVEQLRAQGSLAAIGRPISNYTPPYLYLLALGSYLPVPPMVVVKSLALVLDAALAISVGALAAALRPGPKTGLAAATAALLLPSVVLNGALLGQSDALYVTPLVLALVLILRGRPGWGCALIGIALAVKLQAVFIAPVLALLVVNRRLPLRALVWTVAGWSAAMAPAVLSGRPPGDLPQIYVGQVQFFTSLTLNAPNLYQWVSNPPLGVTGALLLSAVLVGAAVLWLARARVGPDDALVVRAAVLLLMLVPFTLPRMHERYTFAADVLGVAYACVVRRGWVLALAASTVSALAYLPFGLRLPIPVGQLTGLELALILLVAQALVRELAMRRTPDDELEGASVT